MNTNHDKSRIVTKNKTKTEKTERLKPISLEQGEKMAKELKCAKYVELLEKICSAQNMFSFLVFTQKSLSMSVTKTKTAL